MTVADVHSAPRLLKYRRDMQWKEATHLCRFRSSLSASLAAFAAALASAFSCALCARSIALASLPVAAWTGSCFLLLRLTDRSSLRGIILRPSTVREHGSELHQSKG